MAWLMLELVQPQYQQQGQEHLHCAHPPQGMQQ